MCLDAEASVRVKQSGKILVGEQPRLVCFVCVCRPLSSVVQRQSEGKGGRLSSAVRPRVVRLGLLAADTANFPPTCCGMRRKQKGIVEERMMNAQRVQRVHIYIYIYIYISACIHVPSNRRESNGEHK